MSIATRVISVKDSMTFTLYETDLTEMQVGEALKTPLRELPHSNGLKWWIHWYPAGQSSEHANSVSVYLYTTREVSAACTFKVNGSLFGLPPRFTHDVSDVTGVGYHEYAQHTTLHPKFVDGKLLITCEVDFGFPLFTFPKPVSALYSDHVPTDFALVVDSNRVQVHKWLLSLISPVFYAMLSHDTAEARSGEVEISDFDFDTVKTAVDYCYGRVSQTFSVETIINVLRFADKYDIKAVTSVLEKISELLSAKTFPALLRYADDFFKTDMFDECCKFFKVHQKDIVKTEKFATLAPALVERLLKQAFDLNTKFEVLRHAHSNGITFILNSLEQPILETLSLETFCNTVSYAWDCSRDNLKTAGAKFFNENVMEICKMKSFLDLGSHAVHGVMTLRYILLS